MSHLQRSFAKAKLAGLPFEPPLPQTISFLEEEEEDEEEGNGDEEGEGVEGQPPAQDDDSSSASSASSTRTIKPSPSKHLFARPKGFVDSYAFFLLGMGCLLLISQCASLCC